VEAPVRDAWIAVQDSRDRPLGRELHHETLPGETPGHRRVYMHIPLPWPVADRQWVAEFANNASLFHASDGAIWQRRWTLADPSLAPHPDPDATWLPASEGQWTLILVGGGTLCLFTVRTDLGGSIPAAISDTLAMRTVKNGLERLVEHATTMPAHYRAAHEVTSAPDDAPIPLYP
jgi:hypothetical protein